MMKFTSLLLACLGMLTFSNPTFASSNPPNILFILIDDLRYDTFSHMGHPFLETPHIDSLAEEGMQFTNAFVTTSLCSPARATFLTGQYMHHHKVVDNANRMREGTVTFPQLLQKGGYQTAFVGKWHMGGSSDAPRPGFHHWVSFRGQGTYAPEGHTLNVDGKQVPRKKYMTDELTDYAAEWLGKQSSGKPFLLYLSHKGVHGLYDPAPRHRDHYKDKEFPRPETMAETDENNRGKPMWVQDQRNSWHGVEFPYYGRSKQTIAEMYKHYCEMILSVDESLGRLRETLKTEGLAENTLIIFTSDGGHLWGEHGLIDKRCAYEASIRIPFLVAGSPLVKADSQCEAIIANLDVAPTLLDLASIEIPKQMDGQSFARLLRKPNDPNWSRESLLYEYYWEASFPQTPTTFALRNDRYKLIQYHGLWDLDELYDIQNDPQETENLIDDPDFQPLVRKLRRQLHQELKKTGGLAIPLEFKRNHGNNLRNANGSKRSEFPPQMIHPDTK